MEQITIKQKLDAIVYEEINGLKKVLDDWFSSVKNTDELVIARDAASAPIINLYTEYNDPVQYNVKGIKRTDKGYCLELAWAERGSLGDEYIDTHDLDNENTRWEFIPGELDRLTDTIVETLHPEEKCYQFDDYQKAAIKQFNDAMKALSVVNVSLLVDTEEQNFVFANYDGLPSSYLFDGSDGYYQTGYYEHVAEIDVKRLPKSDCQYDTDFMGSDGIDLVKEK